MHYCRFSCNDRVLLTATDTKHLLRIQYIRQNPDLNKRKGEKKWLNISKSAKQNKKVNSQYEYESENGDLNGGIFRVIVELDIRCFMLPYNLTVSLHPFLIDILFAGLFEGKSV